MTFTLPLLIETMTRSQLSKLHLIRIISVVGNFKVKLDQRFENPYKLLFNYRNSEQGRLVFIDRTYFSILTSLDQTDYPYSTEDNSSITLLHLCCKNDFDILGEIL